MIHIGNPEAVRPGDWRPLLRRLLRAAWVAAVLAVVAGSLLPADSRPIQTLDRLPLSDKVEHLGMYAVLALLPALHERRRFVITVAAAAVALGILLEYVQLYTGWRDFEVGDMIADAAGVCAGLALGLPMRSRARRLLLRKHEAQD